MSKRRRRSISGSGNSIYAVVYNGNPNESVYNTFVSNDSGNSIAAAYTSFAYAGDIAAVGSNIFVTGGGANGWRGLNVSVDGGNTFSPVTLSLPAPEVTPETLSVVGTTLYVNGGEWISKDDGNTFSVMYGLPTGFDTLFGEPVVLGGNVYVPVEIPYSDQAVLVAPTP